MMALFAVKSDEEWKAWVAMHLKECSDRVGEFLLQFASSAGIKLNKTVAVPTIISKIGKSFELG